MEYIIKNENDVFDNMNVRLVKWNLINKYLKKKIGDDNYACFNNTSDVNLFNFLNNKKKIGSNSKYGDVYTINLKEFNLKMAIKLIPLTHNDRLYLYNTKYVGWRELKSMKLASKLVKKRITQNLPILYYYSLCNMCKYENTIINLKNKSKTCLICFIEKSDIDLRNWIILKSKKIPKNILQLWYNIFFQIYITIYTINNIIRWFTMIYIGEIF